MKAIHSSISFVSGLLCASIAWADCPSPLPQSPTSEDLRSCFSEIEKLRTDVAALTNKVSEVATSLATSKQPQLKSFVSVRFGQRGSSVNGQDAGEPFIQLLPPGPQRLASVAEFPICGVTVIRVGAANGSCLLDQNAGQWQVTVTGFFACGITCFKPELSQ